MKITLCENNHHFTLHIPLALLTASLWAKWVSREENDISGKTMQAIRKELRKDVKREVYPKLWTKPESGVLFL